MAAVSPTGRVLTLAPAGNSEFVHTHAVRTQSKMRRSETGKPVVLVDVTTNVVRFTTGTREFNGRIPVTVKLEDSRSQKFSEMMAPLGGQSALAPAIGQHATYQGIAGGELSLVSVSPQQPDAQRFVAAALAEWAQSFLSPLDTPDGLVAPGARFESSSRRTVSVSNTKIDVEDLRRFQVMRIEGDLVELVEEIAIRPRRQNQIDGVVGRGRGRLILDLKHGIVRSREESLTTEARVWADSDWVYMQSESTTEAYTVPADEAPSN